MLNTIFMILKIIGIVLAVLAVVLILLLIIPCKYGVEGNFKEERKVCAAINWLWVVVRIRVKYDNGDSRLCVRVLGIPLLNKSLGDSKENDDKAEENDDGRINREVDKKQKKAKNEMHREKTHEEESRHEEITGDEKENKLEGAGKFSIILQKIKNGVGFIKKLRAKFSDVKRLVRSKGAKMAYASTKQTVVKLARHLKPSKLEANLTFGFDSPDKTGKAIAILSMLYGIIHIDTDRFSIQPDFENKVLDGHFFIKGRFVLGYVLFLAFQLYIKREIKFVIKQFKNIASFN